MDNLETDWNDIFKNISLDLDLISLENMSNELIFKYHVAVDMQFLVFDKLFEDVNNDLNLDDVKYCDSSTIFNNNENDLLILASTTKKLYPLRNKIKSIIKNNEINEDDYKKLYKNTINDYLLFHNIECIE
jgi:hypothetical protein